MNNKFLSCAKGFLSWVGFAQACASHFLSCAKSARGCAKDFPPCAKFAQGRALETQHCANNFLDGVFNILDGFLKTF
ncbi:hypothetical protein [Ornithobacterium rhinotracheale]|uniref:hypothetical protein n=3 Tax=Ornithobacterium rhinotracheale TaxID=28251 RepID=UPI001FF1A153|nr:hypothetical protein [Ornithobacterium rhinotracheale]MCK0204810.1 hypothetical protein [Ornithobacterium rhinotracheale]